MRGLTHKMNRPGRRFPTVAYLAGLLAGLCLLASCPETGPGPSTGFGSIARQAALPAAPPSIAASPDGARVAAVCGGTLVFASTADLTTTSVALPANGSHVAWTDGSSAIVSSTAAEALWSVTVGGAPTTAVLFAGTAAGAIGPGALALRGGAAWVAAGTANVGGVVWASPSLGTAMAPLQGVVTGSGVDVALSGDGSRLFLSTGTNVYGVDTDDYGVEWSTPLTHAASHVRPSGTNALCLAAGGDATGGTLTLLNASSGTAVTAVALGAGAGPLAATSTFAFVAETAASTVAAIDIRAGQYSLFERFTVPGTPAALALSPDGNTLYVATSSPSALLAVDVTAQLG